MRTGLRTLGLCALTSVLTLVVVVLAPEFKAWRAGVRVEKDRTRGERDGRTLFAQRKGWQVTERDALWDDCCGAWGCLELESEKADPERHASCRLNAVRNCVLTRELRRRHGVGVYVYSDALPGEYEQALVSTMDGLVWNRLGPQIDSLRRQIGAGVMPVGTECEAEGRNFASLVAGTSDRVHRAKRRQ